MQKWRSPDRFQSRANLISSRSVAAATRIPPMANAPTVTSSGLTAYSSPSPLTLLPPLFLSPPFREECHPGRLFMEPMASRCLHLRRQLRNKVAHISIHHLSTPPQCIRRRDHTPRTTTKIPGADGRVRQRRSTAHGHRLQTIHWTTTRADDLPSRFIAMALRPQVTTLSSKVLMIGTGLPLPLRIVLAAPCRRNSSCGPPNPHHRRCNRCSSRRSRHSRRSQRLRSHHRQRAGRNRRPAAIRTR